MERATCEDIIRQYGELIVYLDIPEMPLDNSFFGASNVKGWNEELWLTYVLDHIKETKENDLYRLLPEFWEYIIWINKHLFINNYEHLTDGNNHWQGKGL